MKKLILLIITVIFYSIPSLASPVNLNGEISFKAFYGAFIPILNEKGNIVYEQNNVIFDNTKDWQLNIPNINLRLNGDIIPNIINLNISYNLIDYNLSQEPLKSLNSYIDYYNFKKDKLSNIYLPYIKYFVLEDANINIMDKPLNGGLIIGQQLIPFNYHDNIFIEPSIAIYPKITPITEYINNNILNFKGDIFSNSTLTQIRDIGFTLYGNYPYFSFYIGMYNGEGPNVILDNNSSKDLFGKIKFLLSNLGELGVSYKREHYNGIKEYSNFNLRDIKRDIFGIQGKLGPPNFYLLGEFIQSNYNLDNELNNHTQGLYISLIGKLNSNTLIYGRYDYFRDYNPLKVSENKSYYDIKNLTLGIKYNVGNLITISNEYSYTWEQFISDMNIHANYGQYSILGTLYF